LDNGPKLAFDEVQGLGPDGYSVCICTTAHAETERHDWENFCANGGGPIVVGAVQGASCFGHAYEFATRMDNDLEESLYIVSKWQSACACANNKNMCHII
jgi:sulfide:quinone oxidoreductase